MINILKIRSVRLDKIVLDSNGNCKLLNSAESSTFDTDCDTNRNHVDFWLLGTAVYKMLTGSFPFSMSEIQMSIVIKLPNLDQFQISHECKDFIASLLVKDKHKRLGLQRNANKAKIHSFFKDIDWVKLEKGELTSPFIPTVVN